MNFKKYNCYGFKVGINNDDFYISYNVLKAANNSLWNKPIIYKNIVIGNIVCDNEVCFKIYNNELYHNFNFYVWRDYYNINMENKKIIPEINVLLNKNKIIKCFEYVDFVIIKKIKNGDFND